MSTKMKPQTILAWIFRHRTAAFLALIGLLALPAFIAGGRASGGSSAKSQYAPLRPWQEIAAESVQQDLAGSPDAALNASLQDKLAALQTMQAERERARAAAVDKPLDLCAERPAAAENDLPRLTGIIEGEMVPFRPEDVLITNQWQEVVNGRWTHAYAGRLGQDAAQGVLIVSVEGSPDGGRFLTPLGGGALRLLAVEGARLTLQDETGALFTFDIPAMQFVESPAAVVPTLQPAPAWTPTPDPCS